MQLGMAKGKLVEKAERLIIEAKYQLPASLIAPHISQAIGSLEKSISAEEGMPKIYEGIKLVKWYLAVDEANNIQKQPGVQYELASEIYDAPDVEQDPSAWKVIERRIPRSVGVDREQHQVKEQHSAVLNPILISIANDMEETKQDFITAKKDTVESLKESVAVMMENKKEKSPSKRLVKEYQAIYKSVTGFEQYGRKLSEVSMSEIILSINDEENITEDGRKFKPEMESKFIFITSLKDYLMLPELIKKQQLTINLMRISDLKSHNEVMKETLEKISVMESGIVNMERLLSKRESEITDIIPFEYLEKKYLMDGFNVKMMIVYSVLATSLLINIVFGVKTVVFEAESAKNIAVVQTVVEAM